MIFLYLMVKKSPMSFLSITTKFLMALFCILFVGCKKDTVDFSKFGSNASPLIISPLGKLQLTLGDLIKSDSLISFDSSGLIRFKTSNDSIYGSNPSDIFSEFDIRELKSVFKLNNFVVPGVDFSENLTLRQMFNDLTESEKEKIEPLDGKLEIFPSLVLFSNERNKVFENVDFKYLDFSGGTLKMTFSNNLPTKMQNVLVNVYDTTLNGDETFIGAFEFPEILPFSSKEANIQLEGKRLTDKMSYVLVNTETTQSPFPVLINLNDNVQINVQLIGGAVVSGLTKLPPISLPNQLNRVDLSSNFPGLELKEVGLLSSKLEIKLSTTIQSQLEVNLLFPDITINNQPLSSINLDNNSNSEKTLDVSGAKIFLGSNLSTPYNNLRIVSSTIIASTSNMVYFDSGDNITLNYGFPDFQIDYVKGFFGTEKTTVNLGNIDLSELATYTSNVTLNNPIINIAIQNSIGVPSKLHFNLTSYNSTGESLQLELDDQEINFPNFSNRGSVYSTNITIDTSNSNIVSCLSLPASKLKGFVEVITNFNGKVNDNFIDKNSEIKIGYSINVPLRFTMDETSITDTLDLAEYMFNLIQAKQVELISRTLNELPLDAKLGFVFLDSSSLAIDSVQSIDFITAADTDIDGKIVNPTEIESNIALSDAIVSKIRQGLITKIVLRIKLNSDEIQNKKVIALNAKSKILTSLALRIKL